MIEVDARTELEVRRQEMVEKQIEARGITHPRVLEALREVPREAFLAERLSEFAYQDTALPVGRGRTLPRPYLMAVMAEALELKPEDRVMEVEAGAGYAAAVLSRIVREVWASESDPDLASEATAHLRSLGYENVHVRRGDGSLGWPEHAPYDAILAPASGPDVPAALVGQLAVGGRLVVAVGEDPNVQALIRVRRRTATETTREELGPVRLVLLKGEKAWPDETAGAEQPPAPSRTVTPEEQAAETTPASPVVLGPSGEPAEAVRPPVVLQQPATASGPGALSQLLREAAEPFDDLESADLGPLLERIGDARLVLLGEATHGTSEFYRMRARITRELIEKKGFTIVSAEADWPDAAALDRWIRHQAPREAEGALFSRFPTWMWGNTDVRDLMDWLRDHNAGVDPERQVGFYGLDLYSLYRSIGEVVGYLDRVDPDAAEIARLRYGCLTPWSHDPALYGQAALTRRHALCERDVVNMLVDLLKKRVHYETRDGQSFFDASQNARVVANAERYYRIMYYGSRDSWNLRDHHMFDTLESVLAFRGPESKAVVWAHNSHLGNAAATEMGARGETNVGELAKKTYGHDAFNVGFGTDHGTVAAATDWDGEMEVKRVRPAHLESYERLCHDSGVPAFFLHLREPSRPAVREELMEPRLQRAIGVIYRPETELVSHYFHAVLPAQFDEYVWFDETSAVTPLGREHLAGVPETYPFGL